MNIYQQLIPINILGLYFPRDVISLVGQYDNDLYGKERIKQWRDRIESIHVIKLRELQLDFNRDLMGLAKLEKYSDTQISNEIHERKKREARVLVKSNDPINTRDKALRRLKALKLIQDPRYNVAKVEYRKMVWRDIGKIINFVIEEYGITDETKKSDRYNMFIPIPKIYGYHLRYSANHQLRYEVRKTEAEYIDPKYFKGYSIEDLYDDFELNINTPKGLIVISGYNLKYSFDLHKMGIKYHQYDDETAIWKIKGGLLSLFKNNIYEL